MKQLWQGLAGGALLSTLASPWAQAASSENTFLHLLKQIQPGAQYSWLNPIIGLLVCGLIAAFFWFGPKLIGAVTDSLGKKGLTVLWALPMLAVFQYMAFLPVVSDAKLFTNDSLELMGLVSLMATLFSSAFIIALEESYREFFARIWRAMSLGMPDELAHGFWFCVYFSALALAVPSFFTSLVAAISFGVLASIALYHLSKKIRGAPATKLRQHGNRRLATFAGHLALAVICLTGVPGYGYSNEALSIVLQLYLAGVMSFCWLAVCEDSYEYENSDPKPNWDLALTISSPMLGCLAWVGVGLVLAVTGYMWAAAVMGLTGVLTALLSRPSRHATS